LRKGVKINTENKSTKIKDGNQDSESNFYYALGHKIRRRIIELIGENGFSSFTELKKELKVSTGTIYHHLDTLSTLIKQKSDKKYYLTEFGIRAYDSIRNNMGSLSFDISKKDYNSFLMKGLMHLTPKRIIVTNNKPNLLVITFSFMILILGGTFCALNGLYPFFLLFETIPEILYVPLFNFLFFIFNFFVFFLTIEAICRIFYKKKGDSMEFLSTFAIIFLPSILYLIIHYFFLVLMINEFTFIGIFDNIIMIIFQVWSLWLLTYSITTYKRLKIENALIISLVLHYGGFSIILLLSI